MISRLQTRFLRNKSFRILKQFSIIPYPIRCFPRAVARRRVRGRRSIQEVKVEKEEKTFKESLYEEDDVNDFLDSALYQ